MSFSGPETGKRKRGIRKAFVEFRRVLARKVGVFGYPFQLAHFSLPGLPISGPPSLVRCRRLRAMQSETPALPQDSSKGGAVGTGCSDLHYIIGCLIM